MERSSVLIVLLTARDNNNNGVLLVQVPRPPGATPTHRRGPRPRLLGAQHQQIGGGLPQRGAHQAVHPALDGAHLELIQSRTDEEPPTTEAGSNLLHDH